MKKFDLVFEQLFQGIAKGKTLQDLAKKHDTDIETLQHQLDKGIKVEMEHTKDKDLAKKIAMDHLYEVPDYYDKLKKAEKK
jgi:ADP-dependent phosphofructokinase/glucokinase